MLEFVDILRRGIPKARLLHGRQGEILSDALDPSRDALDTLPAVHNHGDLLTIPFRHDGFEGNMQRRVHYLDLGIVGDGTLAILWRNGNLPDSIPVLGHRM